jgi:hypothetical protein
VKDVAQLQKDAKDLRAIANDVEKGIIQRFIFVGKRKDDYISLHPYGLNETRELKNIIDDAILAKYLLENICNFLKYVED